MLCPYDPADGGLHRPSAPSQSPRQKLQNQEKDIQALWKQWKAKYKRSYNATVVGSVGKLGQPAA